MRIKVLAAVLAAASAVYGSAITSPSDLVTLMGTPGTTVNFNSFSVPAGTSVAIGCAILTLGSICDGQGPGLVPQGVQFTFGNGGGQWDGVGYNGSTSQEILSGSSPSTLLTITFSTFTTGFALDMRAFPGYPATAMVTIFSRDDTTVIGTVSNISLPGNGANVFEGWVDFSGIGKVELTQSGEDWSPVLDFLEYGAAHVPDHGATSVPEPGSLVCVGLGLVAIAIRRKH